MIRLERIARDLAAELSEKGEADWHRFRPLAKEVGERLDQQFRAIMGPRAGGLGERTPFVAASSRRLRSRFHAVRSAGYANS